MNQEKKYLRKLYLKNQGFTLIELIATLVVLAAIVLITTPIVLNTIKRSKIESYIRSCEAVEKGAEVYVNSELGGLVEDDMIIPVENLKSYVSNISSMKDYVIVNVSKNGTTKYYYTGRDKNPAKQLATLKETIEKSQIKKNATINGTLVNKVYGSNTTNMKNFVWFSGHLWQVLETNESDHTIKLVTAYPVTTLKSGHTTDWDTSWVKKWLINEFYENLDRKDLIKDTNFCMDEINDEPSNYTKKSTCTTSINEKVGLLTYEDYLYAYNGETIDNYKNSYLSMSGIWLMNNTSGNMKWHTYFESTELYAIAAVNNIPYGVRPVISLPDDVLIEYGKGIESDPYILSSERMEKTNSFISEIKIGNYVYLDESNNTNKTTTEYITQKVSESVSTSKIRYRVVKIYEDGSVKLIRASTLNNASSPIYKPFASDYFDRSITGSLAKYINSSFYSWYSDDTRLMIKLSNWDLYEVDKIPEYGGSDTSTSTTSVKTVKANVGLPIYAEMFTAADTKTNYWLMNRWTNDYDIAVISSIVNHVDKNSTSYGIRPTVILKDKTYITGGSGTMNDPYTLGYNNKGEQAPGVFATDSWETIIKNVKSGNISNYNVGDEKEITLTSTDTNIAGTYTVRIANISTPEECSQSGFSQTACGFVIEFVDIIEKRAMNSTNVGGWRDSKMRSYVNNEIYNSLPTILKNNIINTTVVSGHGSTSGEANFTTTDKLYLLSTKEVFENGTSLDTAGAETRQLDYYKELGVTTDNYNGAIKSYNGNSTAWWMRSAYSDDTATFWLVSHTGDGWYIDYANYSYGVSPAFRIGNGTNKLCKLKSGTSKTTSAMYTCTLDEDITFYVLGENESDSNKIDLIMDRNYVDDTVPTTMAWCASGAYNSCNHDGLDPYIAHIQGVFGSSVIVSLPTYNQIYKAAGNKNYEFPLWLYDNQDPDASGYWTSTSDDNGARFVSWDGTFGGDDTGAGLRPVITISKSDIE